MAEQKENNPKKSPLSLIGKILLIILLLTVIAILNSIQKKEQDIIIYTTVTNKMIAFHDSLETALKNSSDTAAEAPVAAILEDTLIQTIDEKFRIELKLKLEGGDSTGASINIKKNGKSVKNIPYKGKHIFIELDLNSMYLLSFSKKDFVTKAVTVNTNVPKGREKEEFAKFIAEIGLAKKLKGDKDINYVGGIKYMESTEDFDKAKN